MADKIKTIREQFLGFIERLFGLDEFHLFAYIILNSPLIFPAFSYKKGR
jgi:hypothetical protein